MFCCSKHVIVWKASYIMIINSQFVTVAMSTEVRVAHDSAERPEPSVKSEDTSSTGKHVTGSPEWFDYMTDRSERGDAQARFSLGQYHYERKEYTIALSYFNMADNKGNIQATYQLAVMYYDGLGVAENQVCVVDCYFHSSYLLSAQRNTVHESGC